MSAPAVNAASMAFKKALIECALGAKLSHCIFWSFVFTRFGTGITVPDVVFAGLATCSAFLHTPLRADSPFKKQWCD
jgi:hypothetical protein